MNDDQLVSATRDAVKNERASAAEVVRHFQEIVDRKLYLKRGYPSMFEMVTMHYGYCNGSAQRRIYSMRLVKDLPEVAAKLESGELSLTAAATVQSFFYAEKKDKKNYSKAQKLEVVEACSKLSVNDVHKELAKRNPQLAKKEFKRAIDDEQIRISFNITNELDKKIEHLKSLMSHTNPNMKMDELLERLVEIGLDKLDPVRKAQRAAKKKKISARETALDKDLHFVHSSAPMRESELPPEASDSLAQQMEGAQIERLTRAEQSLRSAEVKRTLKTSTEARTRYIPSHTRHALWSDHDGNGCEYIDDQTGRRCGSRHFLQIEHITPFAHGGVHERANLKLFCGTHNRATWDKVCARTKSARETGCVARADPHGPSRREC